MPIISVIIPTFNAEKTILETVQSALQQSFADTEILVINDGSTDATLEQLTPIQDDRLRILNFANGGVAASRNRGIQHAMGQYFSFLDSDDVWAVNKLEDQLLALNSHPDAAVAYSWNDYIDEMVSSFTMAGTLFIKATSMRPCFAAVLSRMVLIFSSNEKQFLQLVCLMGLQHQQRIGIFTCGSRRSTISFVSPRCMFSIESFLLPCLPRWNGWNKGD